MINHPNRSRKKAKAAAATSFAPTASHDHDYSGLLKAVSASFEDAIIGAKKLFLTNADGLNDLYLKCLPVSDRQEHNCHACRRFIETYGALAVIGDQGEPFPVMWSAAEAPEIYQTAFVAMYERVKRARVEAPFLTNQAVWGIPVTGTWRHMSVNAPASLLYRERLLTPKQAMAAAKENFRTVAAALGEFTAPMLDEALRLLQADALARSERFVGPVKWLRQLHDRPKGRAGENIMWLAIATAPEGYCHPKASVIGPLLDDIVTGLPFDEIKARFEAKVHPLMYQRPQAAPTAGNIKAAEAIFEKMGLAPSLERRFARLEELETIWLPAVVNEPKPKGTFGHLKAKNTDVVRAVEMPALTMTWDKFRRTILSAAERIELQVPSVGRFIGMTTAVHADAPLLFKWDNPVAWFCYPMGSPAQQWGLRPGFANVVAVAPLPTLWGPSPKPHLGEGVVMVLENCMDGKDAGNALFPECLRDDLHAVRSTIEAYSRGAKISKGEGQVACGYDLRKPNAEAVLRVCVSGSWTTYRIDRWD
jgi:hypothetical protein